MKTQSFCLKSDTYIRVYLCCKKHIPPSNAVRIRPYAPKHLIYYGQTHFGVGSSSKTSRPIKFNPDYKFDAPTHLVGKHTAMRCSPPNLPSDDLRKCMHAWYSQVIFCSLSKMGGSIIPPIIASTGKLSLGTSVALFIARTHTHTERRERAAGWCSSIDKIFVRLMCALWRALDVVVGGFRR